MEMVRRAVFLGVSLTLLSAVPALAHEKRAVGKYTFVVGFINEPAFSGQMNGLDLSVAQDATPVTGLEDALKAEVVRADAGRSMDLPLKARYKKPGFYAGYFLPTKPGSYVFRIHGEIEGEKIDERFESGPGRFSDVQDTETLRYP